MPKFLNVIYINDLNVKIYNYNLKSSKSGILSG